MESLLNCGFSILLTVLSFFVHGNLKFIDGSKYYWRCFFSSTVEYISQAEFRRISTTGSLKPRDWSALPAMLFLEAVPEIDSESSSCEIRVKVFPSTEMESNFLEVSFYKSSSCFKVCCLDKISMFLVFCFVKHFVLFFSYKVSKFIVTDFYKSDF
jgi:hypothetical protein